MKNPAEYTKKELETIIKKNEKLIKKLERKLNLLSNKNNPLFKTKLESFVEDHQFKLNHYIDFYNEHYLIDEDEYEDDFDFEHN